MRKYIYIIFCLCAFLGTISCIQEKTEQPIGQKIVFDKSKDFKDNRKVIESARYLQLETNDSCLISYVSQLFCTSKEIIIFDMHSQNVFVFDYNGRFLRKIQKQGQGPGEYAMIMSIAVDEASDEIQIVDSGNRILCYKLSTFDFLNGYTIDAISVQKYKNNGFFLYNALPINNAGHSYNSHLVYYEDGKIKNEYIPIDFASGYLMEPNYRFYKFNGNVFFYPPFQPCVYKLSDTECKCCYDIQYGSYTFPPLDYLNSCDKNENYILNLRKENYVYSTQIFENEVFLLSTYYVGLRAYIGIYNKDTKQNINLLRKDFENNPTTIDWLKVIASHKDEFVTILNHSDLIESISEIKDTNLKNLATMPEDSNPILTFIKFKI